MSTTSCCESNSWLMLHDDDGQAAAGVPHVEGSTMDVDELSELGTSLRCVTVVSTTVHDTARITSLQAKTICWFRHDSVKTRQERKKTVNAHKTPVSSNCVAHTPPPLSANPFPKLVSLVSPTLHPTDALTPWEQLVLIVVPVCMTFVA